MVTETSCVAALDATLEHLELPYESQALVALASSCAYAVDTAPLTHYASTARAFLAVLKELDQYRKAPDVTDEDPFDALSRRLAAVGDAED